jgi:hypothetical protein
MYNATIHAAAAVVMIASVAAITTAEGDLRGAAMVSFLLSLYPTARTEMPTPLRGGLVASTLVIAFAWYAGTFTVRTYAVGAGFAILLLGSLFNEDLRPTEGTDFVG